MTDDEIAEIRAAHAARDERLSTLPTTMDRGAAIRALSLALESHRVAGSLLDVLDALTASRASEAALAEGFFDYGRALRMVLDMAEKRAHRRITAYVTDVLGNGHDKARTSEHLTMWERGTPAALDGAGKGEDR